MAPSRGRWFDGGMSKCALDEVQAKKNANRWVGV
jgi:hypothetical protein